MLKTWVENVIIMKVIDNKMESKSGDIIPYKTVCFFTEMDSYTITLDKSVWTKIKDGMTGKILIGWETEKVHGITKYKPRIYDFNEIKK